MTITSYKIGTANTVDDFKLLSDWEVVDPQSDFFEYSTTAKMANGVIRGLGYPRATWHYGYLTSAQYEIMRDFCSGASANVYIATMINDGTFSAYSAVMSVPENYTIRAGTYIDVTFQFTNLVAAT